MNSGRNETNRGGSPEQLEDIIGRLKIKSAERLDSAIENVQMVVGTGSRRQAPHETSSGPPSPSLVKKYSRIPVDMTRVSPFFIMHKSEMRKRPYETRVIKNSWGLMTIVGERLSVREESICLVIIRHVFEAQNSTISMSRYEILKELGLQITKGNYDSLWDSLTRLGRTQVQLEIWDKNSNGGERGKVVRMFNTILAGGINSDHSKKMVITVNPYFMEMCGRNLLTYLDLTFRKSLKGDVSKALYRFYQGQPKDYRIATLKLCDAINLNTDQDLKILRRTLRYAHDELKEKGFLKCWKCERSVYTIHR